MIVVIEQVRGDDHRLRWATRLVLWEDEPEPRLADVRLALEDAKLRLPSRLEQLTIKRVDEKKKR